MPQSGTNEDNVDCIGRIPSDDTYLMTNLGEFKYLHTIIVSNLLNIRT